MRVLLFLLETFFFVLVAAALLRAWMNQLRINMSGQPGRFAMAVTHWLVRPVRQVLPRSLTQSRVDWGSLVAAVLLSLAQAGVWLLVVSLFAPHEGGMSAAWLVAWLSQAGFFLLRTLLQGLMLLMLVYAILSWVQPMSAVMGTLDRLCSPFLRPIRRVLPLIGGVDLSVLVLMLLLQVCLMLIS